MIEYTQVCYKNNNTGLHKSQEMGTPFLVLFLCVYRMTGTYYAPTQRMREGEKRGGAGPDLSSILPFVAFIRDTNDTISAA